jgi:hypothetical protein
MEDPLIQLATMTSTAINKFIQTYTQTDPKERQESLDKLMSMLSQSAEIVAHIIERVQGRMTRDEERANAGLPPLNLKQHLEIEDKKWPRPGD